VRDTSPLQKEISIRVEAAEVGRFIDDLVATYRKSVAFHGFRKGKAPDGVVRTRFQDEIEAAVHNELVPRSIEQALAEKQIHPAGPGDVSDLRYRAGDALCFTFRVDVWPDLELKSYEAMMIEQVVAEIAETQVDQYLAALQEQAAEAVPVDRVAQPGDIVDAEIETVDLHGRRIKGTKKEKVTLEVDSPGLLREFREAAQEATAGDVREFEVHYADDYQTEQLRGQTRRYRMRVAQIREKKIPPLDDQFAERVSPGSDLEGLRARARLRLESEARMAARERLEEALVDRLIQENPFELPESVVATSLERLRKRFVEEGRRMEPAEFERSYRPPVERARRRDFILGKVAKREGIGVDEKEVEEEITRMARRERRSVEEVREDLGDLERLRDFLFERKIFDALLKKVEIREVRVPGGGAAKGDEPSRITSAAGNQNKDVSEGGDKE
jgi:trigger factor